MIRLPFIELLSCCVLLKKKGVKRAFLTRTKFYRDRPYFPAKILVRQTEISRTKIPMTGLYHGKVISNSQTQLDTRPIPNLKPEKACLGMSYPTLLVEFFDYRIARNFCGDFNLANWRIFLLNYQN